MKVSKPTNFAFLAWSFSISEMGFMISTSTLDTSAFKTFKQVLQFRKDIHCSGRNILTHTKYGLVTAGRRRGRRRRRRSLARPETTIWIQKHDWSALLVETLRLRLRLRHWDLNFTIFKSNFWLILIISSSGHGLSRLGQTTRAELITF